ncbi:LCP family protein [Gloeobacter kilaueensis]|uniref:Cell envelope-related transcriptional attenuator n=1 Tax=Gloeobacter kilaueensis (strain ATCC BAA-2537 / CCAP 1431/1 / ULC 316 / JS1) TaxID=1183438 RepID=U5QF71_GLOK1|nr:LCP family protein [Gloeobacter kilaueensis]AGY57581.1 cell envelope-related transcriptional attenuator [Gloeobacter kilaueensis JS1]
MSKTTQPPAGRSSWNSWLLLIAVAIVTCLGVAGGMTLWFSRPFENNQHDKTNALFEAAQLGNDLNILVLGTDVVADRRATASGFKPPTNSFDGRSDTILLAHFNPEQKKVNVLSVPRDTRTEIPGHGEHKINVANVYGGPALAARTVTRLTGAEINRYVRINTLGVIQLIDVLGGVTVYIPRPMKYSDDSQHLYINLPQGWHTLSGLQAQQYMRFREDGLGDIGRVQRQQGVLRALAERAVRPENLLKIGPILDTVKNNIDTNLTVDDIFALAKFATQIDLKQDLRMVMLPGRFSRPDEFEVSYWIPERRKAAHLGEQFFNAPATGSEPTEKTPLLPGQIRLTIQNATGTPGMARKLGHLLQKQGFRSIGYAADRPDPIWRSEIIAQGGNLEAAQLVSDALQVGAISVESTGALDSDVTLRLGKDWLKRRAEQQQSTPQ